MTKPNKHQRERNIFMQHVHTAMEESDNRGLFEGIIRNWSNGMLTEQSWHEARIMLEGLSRQESCNEDLCLNAAVLAGLIAPLYK